MPKEWFICLVATATLLGGSVPCSAQRFSARNFGEGSVGISSAPGSVATPRFSSFLGGPGGRSSLAGWRAYSASLQKETDEAQTLRVGPLAFRFGVGSSITYDTNINSSPDEPLADIILQPFFQIGFGWPITRRNRLDLDLNISYQYYLLNPDFGASGFTISPRSLLEFNLYSGDFVFTVYDFPTITTNPFERDPALTNTAFIRQFSNRAGVRLLWDWNKLISSIVLERRDTLAIGGNFDSLNATTNSLLLQAAYLFTPTATVGSRVSVSTQEFSTNALNDGVLSQAGVFIDMRLTRYTSLYFEVGAQAGIFDDKAPVSSSPLFSTDAEGFNTNVESTLGGGDYLQPYFVLGITNRLNRYYTHDLFVSREVVDSSVSNFREQYLVAYSFNYRMSRLIALEGTASAATGSISSSSEALTFFQAGASLGVSFQVTKNSSLGLSYSTFFSNLTRNDQAFFTRQLISLTAQWNF